MKEIWKDIKWYEWRHQISNLWRVRSTYLWNTIIRKQDKMKNWYMAVCLRKEWKIKRFLVHRLKAIMFIDNPYNKRYVWHKDNNPSNNWYIKNNEDNLYWCTASENIKYSYDCWRIHHALWKFWKESAKAIKVIQKTIEWKKIKTRWSIIDASRSLNIYHQHISKCCKWKQITTWWYKWEYVK